MSDSIIIEENYDKDAERRPFLIDALRSGSPGKGKCSQWSYLADPGGNELQFIIVHNLLHLGGIAKDGGIFRVSYPLQNLNNLIEFLERYRDYMVEEIK